MDRGRLTSVKGVLFWAVIDHASLDEVFGWYYPPSTLQEVHHNGPSDEMWFMLGTHEVRFSKVEFCLITELRFRVVLDTNNYVSVDNGLHHRYFGGKDEILSFELRDVLRRGEFQKAYDSVKPCLIYMLNWILMGLDERVKIPVWQLRSVDDLDGFDAFP
ncbi:hypothetical protein Ddye_000912 [Dipteronia dyeriana]|uniref:DUF1985 domain-containing protein n=1 Tax=Dipteronia dyeriana TaxID=168575 RepID=A0AAE0CTI8_9ROSI|nr:hypothetical protein Ddye_000912 [Dipteronia dyeriana]